MTKEEVFNGMRLLKALNLANPPDLSNQEKSSELTEVWFAFLHQYSAEQYKLGIYFYAKKNRFFPTISDIIDNIPSKDKYAQPEAIYKIYMAEKEDDLIKQAFKDCGYTRYDLKQLDTKTIEINVKPRVEKYYNKIVEQDRLKCDLLALESNQKLIGG